MRPFIFFSLVAAATLAMAATPALSDTSETAKFDPARMWECLQADGSSIYTNKEQTGCKLMTLRELSVVPSLDNMPTYRSPYAATPSYDMPYSLDHSPAAMGARGQTVPAWAQDWHSSIAWSGGSVQAEVCSLYGEWINLVQKTRGGFFYGTDPSYGGDLTGRNQRGASYSFYDNARYHALSRIFGTGFVPVGCQ
ncbi:MAG TPA: hypothetical protein VFJ56_03265 [Nitrospira sp.]|nr:hypothetical protein [Nitrospira sp.]